MLTLYVSRLGIALQFLLLIRGLNSGNVSRFPYFFAYITSGIAQSVVGYYFLIEHPNKYSTVFWPLQFISLFIGCGVVLEIFGHVLTTYPGAEKFAKVICSVVFLLLFVSTAIYLKLVPSATLANSEIELERNLRMVQTFALIGTVGSILYFDIHLGKNMRGMITGFGLYLGTSMVSLAVRLAFGPRADVWRTIRPFSFDVALLIWLVSLWDYHPDPGEGSGPRDPSDYETLVATTRRALRTVQSYLGRLFRP